jgi:hypothetical protein
VVLEFRGYATPNMLRIAIQGLGITGFLNTVMKLCTIQKERNLLTGSANICSSKILLYSDRERERERGGGERIMLKE